MEERTFDFFKSVAFFLLGALVSLGAVVVDNSYYEQSVESELVIMDAHLVKKANIENLTNYKSITINESSPIELNFLETNITFVNSVYSKYPLRIIHVGHYSRLSDDVNIDLKRPDDWKFESSSESVSGIVIPSPTGTINGSNPYFLSRPIVSFKSTPIFPSEIGNINIGNVMASSENINVTVSLVLIYYDPMSEERKEIIDDMYILHFYNGSVEQVTPLKEYVTVVGHSESETSYGIFT